MLSVRDLFVFRSLLICTCWAPICLGQIFSQAQAPPPNQNAASPTKVNVSGTVVNSVTGEPLRRALVDLAGAAPRSAFTGADGRFQLANVPEGRVWLNAQKPGYFPEQQAGGNQFRSMINVTTGMSDVVVKLVPAGRIVGQIVTSEGEPIESVNVQLSADQIVNGRRRRQMRGGSSTDDTGHFVIDNLTPGAYYVHTAPHQTVPMFTMPGPVDQNQPPTYPPVYYPNSPDENSAQVIDLKPGQDVQADFTLKAEPTFRVSGQATGAAMGLQVMEQGSGGMPVFHPARFEGKTGRFVLFLTSGAWKLRFSSNNAGQMLSGRLEVEVRHADVDNLRVALVPGATIPIHVDRTAVTQNAVNTQPSRVGGMMGMPGNGAQPVQLMLHNGSEEIGQSYQPPANPEAPPSEDNQGFRNVPPGAYRVSADTYGAACVGSISYGGADLMRDELQVPEGGQMQPIVVRLRSDCGSIQANVHFPSGDTAAQGGSLLLVPDANPSAAKVMQAAPNQATTISGLSPGDYKVYALSSVEGLEYGNPDALKDFSSQHVSVSANGSASVTLDLVSRGSQ